VLAHEDEEARALMASELVPEPEQAGESPARPETRPETPSPDLAAKEAWSSLTEDLVGLRGREVLPPWFDQFEGAQLEGTTLTVLVPNGYAANHLNDNFGEDLIRLWQRRSGAEAVLEVTTDLLSGKRAVLGASST
jgi:hypothetical protein